MTKEKLRFKKKIEGKTYFDRFLFIGMMFNGMFLLLNIWFRIFNNIATKIIFSIILIIYLIFSFSNESLDEWGKREVYYEQVHKSTKK